MSAARFRELANAYLSLRSETKFRRLFYKLFLRTKAEPPYSKVIEIGNPILRNISTNVEVKTSERGIQFKNRDEAENIVDQMLKVRTNGIGLSAPKLGINQRIILIKAGCQERKL